MEIAAFIQTPTTGSLPQKIKMTFGQIFYSDRMLGQRGVIAVDFLFAMVLAAVLCMMMFAFATTLSMIEVAQYVAFSTSRAHAAGHETQSRQIELGRAKFASFTKTSSFPAIAPLLTNDWFEMDPSSLDIRGGGQESGGSQLTFDGEYGSDDIGLPKTGVRFRFRAKVLKMNLPLLGILSEDDDFGTWVTGFMIRESTSEECRSTMEENIRYSAIRRLDQGNRFERAVSTPSAGKTGDYFPMEDNGC